MKHVLSFLFIAFFVLMENVNVYADDNQIDSEPNLPDDSVAVTPKMRTLSYFFQMSINESWTPSFDGYENLRFVPLNEICDGEWYSNYYVAQCDVKVGTIVSKGLTLEVCLGTDLDWITTCPICDIPRVIVDPSDPDWDGSYQSLFDAEEIVRENAIHGEVYGGQDSTGNLTPGVWYHEEFPMPDADVTILPSVWYGIPMGVSSFAVDNVGKIHTGPSSLFVESEGVSYEVYTMDGVLSYRGSDAVLSLNPGIYVVKVGNGLPVKVVVP